MSVQERIRVVRIIEKIEKNKEYSERIGMHIITENKKGKEKNEVHRC